METREQSALEELQGLFQRRWRCEVFTSGFHNGCHCNPTEPHDGWDCGYKWVAPALNDSKRVRALLDKEE